MRMFVSSHALGLCAALLLGLLSPELAAQCQRCGQSAQCISADTGGDWCFTECAGTECLAGKISSQPGAAGDIKIRHEHIAHLAEHMPLAYDLLRTLTRHGRRGLDIGYFEGTHAISSTQAPDDMELAWRFVGFVDRVDHEMVLHVELDGHQTFKSLTLTLAVDPVLSSSDRGGQAAATGVDGSSVKVNW